MVARREFCRAHDAKPEEVGCFFITPCAAKVTAIRNPIGHETSAVDGAISMLEIYGLLSSHIKSSPVDAAHPARATAYGVGWANSGGEAAAVCPEHSMSVDGIENVIRVLEEIENDKLPDLVFLRARPVRADAWAARSPLRTPMWRAERSGR